MNLHEIHAILGSSVVVYAGLAAIWGLITVMRGRGVDSNFLGVLAVQEILILAQGLLGVILYFGDSRPAQGVHILYGVVAAITIPAFFALSRGRDDRIAALAYTAICVFLAVIALRAVGTGG
ncbi:MAG: hypothetical protein GTO18_07960 [Anaerolineales bacterium]|nr:hypothetical protein [Anaerolineales bacterium]